MIICAAVKIIANNQAGTNEVICGRKQFGRSTYCGDCGNRLIWDGGSK